MISSINSVNVNKPCYNGQKRQDNVSFTMSSPKEKAAEIGENIVVGLFKLGIKAVPKIKKASLEAYDYLKHCYNIAKEDSKKVK
jgi:hypothetical protein